MREEARLKKKEERKLKAEAKERKITDGTEKMENHRGKIQFNDTEKYRKDLMAFLKFK